MRGTRPGRVIGPLSERKGAFSISEATQPTGNAEKGTPGGKADLRRKAISLVIRLAVLAVVLWAVFTFCFLITQVNGQGMFPAMKDGDVCVIFRRQTASLLGQRYVQDDVIAYRVDGKRYFGRVVAVAGDTVSFGSSGSVIVNEVAEGGEILFPTYKRGELKYPYTVPEDCVFVLGDYRTGAADSRDLGPIPLESVEGKVITIMRRREL